MGYVESGKVHGAFIELVDQRLDALLPGTDQIPGRLHEAMRYACLAPGKRIRPSLVLASAQAVGGRVEDALDAACAVEMVHAFSLIHDDLPAIDDDALRRGRPTCHIVYGEGLAILAGDALFGLAFETLSHARTEPAIAVAALRSLSVAVGSLGLVGGEVVDVMSEGVPVDAETLSIIHRRKTGALIRCACELGALFGGADAAQLAAIKAYGESIGLAFQIVDDILNEIGTQEELGKAAGSDQARSKATYPALFGLEESRRHALALAEEGQRELDGLSGDTSFLREIARYTVARSR